MSWARWASSRPHPSRRPAPGKAPLTHPLSQIDDAPPSPATPAAAAAPDLFRGPALPAEDSGAHPLAVDAPPAFADGSFNKLHPNYVAVDRVGWIIFAAIVGVVGLGAFLIFLAAMGPAARTPWIVLGVVLTLTAGAVVGTVALPRRSYEATSYAVSELGLAIRRGIWWKHVIDVPRSRVQHTDVQQGPLARYYGIGKLIVYTAGTQHASVTLDGLEHGRALEMRDYLLKGGEGDDVV